GRGIQQAVHGQPAAVSDHDKEERAEHAQMSAGGACDGWTSRRHPHAALDQIIENGAEQADDQCDQNPVVEKPLEGQPKEIETKIDAEQRVGLSDGYRVLGKLV